MHTYTRTNTHTDSIWQVPSNDRRQFSAAVTFGEELELPHTDVSWEKSTGQRLGVEFSNDDDSVCIRFAI